MDWRLAFRGSFISAIEFAGKEPTLTITGVKMVTVDDEKTKKTKEKLVVYFKETDRGWVPCKTTAMCLAGMFASNETAAWVGKHVTLYSAKVKFGPDVVDGIRVRGSPDLTAPVTITIKLPKKKAQAVVLLPTGKKNGKAPVPVQASEPEPEFDMPDEDPSAGQPIIDPETGEVFP